MIRHLGNEKMMININQEVVQKPYHRAYVEISNICNLQCTFCPVVERDKKVVELPELAGRLAEVNEQADDIYLHLMGEPTHHPQFTEIINLANEKKYSIKITTNGLLVKKYREILVSPSIKQINFSLQSYRDNFPGRPLGPYLIPILEFIRYASEVRPDLYCNLRFWNLQGADESRLVFRLDPSQPIDGNQECFEMIEDFFGVKFNQQTLITKIKSKNLFGRVYLHFDSRFEWPSLTHEVQGVEGRCWGLINQFGIHADGKVVPCCLDKEAVLELGNVNEQPLAEILAGARAKNIRQGFERGQRREELCQKCQFSNRFKILKLLQQRATAN
jgi:radical SAM protein with 4Fe4S-binding SPASM domain